MPNVGFGGSTSGGSYSAGTLYSDGIGLPTGRAMANGSQACLITALYAYVRGNGANPVGRIRLGSAVTGNVTATAGSDSTPGIGYFATNHWLVQGGTARFSWEGPSIGPVYFGKGGGGTVYGPGSYNRAGTLGGAYTYVQAPTAPRSLSALDGVGTATLSWAAPSDNGESGITDYIVEYAKNSSFTGLVRTTTTATSIHLTGLDPVTYYFRVAARNAVTNAAGTWSVYSNVATATLATVPDAPAAPSEAEGPRLVHYTWVAPNDGGAPILEYELQIATNTGFSAGVQTFSLEALNRSVTGLTSGTNYYGRVRARNSVGWSAWSAYATSTIPARTFQDTVGNAAVHISGGVQVELRSNGAETPTVSLVYSTVTSGTTTTTIATVPTGSGSDQFFATGHLSGLALTADVSGNLYVVGRRGNSTSALLVYRYVRNSTTSWSLAGINSQTLPDTGDALTQFAATVVNSNLLVLARRAGSVGVGSLSFALCSVSAITASTGTMFLASGSDPSWLPTATSAGTANSGLLDAQTLSTNRAVIAGNGMAVVDVSGSTITSVTKSPNATYWPGDKIRLVVINSAVFVVLRNISGGINVLFYNVSGALLHERTIALSGASDQWDAIYDSAAKLLLVKYMSAARTLSQVAVNTTSYTASGVTTLTAAFGAGSTTNSKLKVPSGAVDERHVLVTGAGVAGSTQSQSAYSDTSSNQVPVAPALTSRSVFDATGAAVFSWTFGDPNSADTQSAFQLVIENASTGAVAHDTGKVVSGNSTRTVAGGTLTNGTTYRWKVRTYDALDAVGSYSGYLTFPVAAAGAVTITSPASNNPVSIVNYQDIVWSYSGSTSAQAKARVRVLNHATGAVLQDTGMVPYTANTFTVTNLLSDIQQRVEVTVENTVGLTSSVGTRLLTPSFSVPETPLLLTAPGNGFIWVQISNPTPTGSKPEVEVNEVYRRIAGHTDWTLIVRTAPGQDYEDYAVGSNVSYDYFVKGVADSGTSSSAISTTLAQTLDGVWLHSFEDPVGTLMGFPYGNKGSRTETLLVEGVVTKMVGRRAPLAEFGIGQSKELVLDFMVPWTEGHDGEIARIRELVRTRSLLVYRDNRGRMEYGVLADVAIVDEQFGSTVSGTFRTSNPKEV